MYTPPAFRQTDPDEIARFLDAHPLATLVTMAADGFQATPIPLLRVPGEDGGMQFLGHWAKANPQWRSLAPDTPALAIFAGPGAYVSPGWYPSKAVDGRVVPTWNYMAVHCHGRIEVVEEEAGKREIVSLLTRRFEADRPAPWAVSDAPADYLAAQLKGIVGLRLRVDRVEAKWKLSQNRQPADRAGVRDGLSASPDPQDRAVAAAMGPAAAG